MREPHYRSWEPLLPPTALATGSLLVVAPHPDDEVIGAAGLIMGHVDAGRPVTLVVLSDGSQGVPGSPSGPDYARLRQDECRAAARELGVSDLRFLDLPDGGLRELAGGQDSEAVRRLRAILKEVEPDRVALPSPFELHPDHKAACLIGELALVGLESAPALIAYEVGSLMPINLLLDLSGHEERKLRALACYASQIEHHDIPGKVEARDRARTANVPMAEISHCEGYLVVAPGRFPEYRRTADELCRLIDSMTPRPPHV
ncbi:MAG: PIG-L family deacetylase [Planctomycetes bacterium]|nr:PIG-L family deacetylase [Planctomycetota bacterium]